jgi:hypothetical protein
VRRPCRTRSRDLIVCAEPRLGTCIARSGRTLSVCWAECGVRLLKGRRVGSNAAYLKTKYQLARAQQSAAALARHIGV